MPITFPLADGSSGRGQGGAGANCPFVEGGHERGGDLPESRAELLLRNRRADTRCQPESSLTRCFSARKHFVFSLEMVFFAIFFIFSPKIIWQEQRLCYIKPHAPRKWGSADENAGSSDDVGSEKNWKIFKIRFDKSKNDAKLNLTPQKGRSWFSKLAEKSFKKVSNETWQNKKAC